MFIFARFLLQNDKMWPRFDEMRKLGQAAEGQSKSKKRKSLRGNDRTPLERRKRSLFSISPLVNETAAGRVTKVVRNKRDRDAESIGEFSSDDEQCHCLVAGSNSQRSISTEQKHRSKKPASSSSVKCNTRRPTIKLEDSTSLIKWSDSDSEHDNLLINDKLSSDTEQDPIGVFESPVKQVIVHPSVIREPDDSPVTIEDYPLSIPLDIKQEKLEEEDSKDNEFVPKLIDSSKKKRSKDIKGGLAEQCRKVISRERSDIVFWKHSLSVDKNEITSSIPTEEKPKLYMKVAHIENDFSLTVLKCHKIKENSRAVYVILPISNTTEHKIQIDDILEVYPPFRTIPSRGAELPVLLCAYYFKVVTDSQENLGSTEMHCDFDRSENGILESEEASKDMNFSNPVSCMEESNQTAYKMETLFCNCSLSQPVTFCANVIKSNLSTRNRPPIFNASCDKSILDHVKGKCKETSMKYAFELFLILKDRIGQIACLTLLLKDNKTRELCHMSETKGNPLVFNQFILKDIKSISCNPTVLSVLKSLDLDSRRSFLGDICYIFTDSEESAILVNERDLSSPYKSSNELHSLLPSSQYQRVSFYAHCVCIVPGIHDDNPSSSGTCSLFVAKYETAHWKEITQAIDTGSCCDPVLVCIRKLSTCYVPEVVTKNFLEKGKVFFFKDLLQHSELKYFVLDSLSRICIVQSEKNTEVCSADDSVLYGTLFLGQEVMDTLYRKSFKLIVSNLSFECEEDTIVSVKGIISGLIDDSAVFWTVCGNCGSETTQPITQPTFYCNSCQQHVKSNFHVQLEVTLDCKDVPDVQVTVKLLERTIFEYLPMKISDDFNGYDPECIIGKSFGRQLCHVSSVTNRFNAKNGKVSIVSIKLKEVIVVEDMLNYLK